MKAASIRAAGLLLGLLWSLAGCAPRDYAVPVRVHLEADHYRLPNGLEVVLHEDHSMRTVAVLVHYDVGSTDDPPGASGLAHLVEHLSFEGPLGPEHHLGAALSTAGGRGVNAFTNFDETTYRAEMPPSELPMALWAEAHRMHAPTLHVDAAMLERERAVVDRKRAERGRDAAERMKSVLRALYAGHPYARPVLGVRHELATVDVEAVRRFAARFYRSSNATLVVVGDFDRAAASELVARYFGALEGGPPREARVQPAPSGAPRTAPDRRAGETSPWLTVGWLAPREGGAGYEQTRFLRMALASCVFAKRAERVAFDGHVSLLGGRLGTALVVDVELPSEKDASVARALVERCAEDVQSASYLRPFMSLVRSRLMVDDILSLARPMDRGERILASLRTTGRPDSVQSDLRVLERISSDDVADVARAVFAKPPAVMRSLPEQGPAARSSP